MPPPLTETNSRLVWEPLNGGTGTRTFVWGIMGADGEDGVVGADGNTILNGTGSPDNSLGRNGDFYISDTFFAYGPKAAGVWPAGVNMIGTGGGGSGTVTSVTLTQPAAGLTISNSGVAITSTGTRTLALANDLLGVEGLAGTGLAVRTATDAWTTRTLTGTAGRVTVTNGDGVSGNPTADLVASGVTAASYGSASAVAAFTVDAYGRITVAGSTAIALAGSAITSGTVADARIAATIARLNVSQTFTQTQTFTDLQANAMTAPGGTLTITAIVNVSGGFTCDTLSCQGPVTFGNFFRYSEAGEWYTNQTVSIGDGVFRIPVGDMDLDQVGYLLVFENYNAITFPGTLTATEYNGPATGLTGIPAGQLTGSISDARLSVNVPILVGGLLPTSVLPPLAISQPFAVASQAAMLALTAQRGDVAIRSDLSKSFVLSTDSPGTLADWLELKTPTDAVLSVNGQTGVVLLGAADVSAQPADATLTALAGLTISANSLIVGTGADAFSITAVGANQFLARSSTGNLVAKTITDYGLSLVATTDAAAARTLLVVPTGSGSSTGTNTGDQTSVTGNAGTATALATARSISMTGDVAWTISSFDGTGNVTAAGTIANNAVTYAKMQDVSATKRVVGRNTAGSGDPEEVTATQLIEWLDTFSNGDGLVRSAGAWVRLANAARQGTTVYVQTPADGTFTLTAKARIAGTIDGLYGLKTSAGTLTLTVKINGTNVTGLASLSVTSSAQDATATAANVVAVGDRITLVIASTSGAADLEGTLQGTRTG